MLWCASQWAHASHSMPPTSKTIFEEGAQIKSFKIVSKGKYDRDQLVKYLMEEPAKYEGCSGSRCLRDVESDLQAQIAANNKGQPAVLGSESRRLKKLRQG